MRQEQMIVTKQIEIAKNIYEMTLRGQLVEEMKEAGQFLHLKPNRTDLILRRPISLANIDSDNNECQIIYRASGDGTKDLAQLKAQDSVDVLGPLGTGFGHDFIAEQDLVFVIGGGIGVPPLYQLGKELKEKNAKIIFMNGFANRSVMFYEREFSQLGTLMISTDDGSYGIKGHVGQLIDQAVSVYGKPKAVFSCGPIPLLKTVETKFNDIEHVYLSMEERMACGVGACYACVCESKTEENKTKKVCEDGPVFKNGEVRI
ncbi:dihydroorotate dehydrogenase electron transfer subunit [Vagococcus silagei]|uniref:Dihydroorotate dehydrogenase B (NAD(+)), electron transfer subunit n=1 Tax=Vagococcus silagei TaxID=2508885 RepID=A0A4S3B392_9ENTE|nr:dihydroorotate dehydrogenase electron transfer subunit [Vagococcus silagei]THB61531.1 dihydroorotate dehydrogenase electron transfer subunit [Vagococcus silagei]